MNISGTSHNGESLEKGNKTSLEGTERGPHQDCDDYRYGFQEACQITCIPGISKRPCELSEFM